MLCLLLLLTYATSEPAAESDFSVLDILEEERATEDVVVVSSRAETTVEEAPAIVSAFSAEQMRKLGVQTLADLLELMAPIRLWRGPNGDVAPVIRGLGVDNGVAILMDGVPILDTVTGQFAHYDLSIQGFKRVEVQRGPGSALYGGNAQTAVINLVSFDDERGAEVRAMAGTATDLRGHARAHFQLGAAGKLSLFAQVQRTDGVAQSLGPDGTTERSDLADIPGQSFTDPANPLFVSARKEPSTYAQGAIAYYAPFGFYARSRLLFRTLSPLVNPSVGGGKGTSAITPEGSFHRDDLTIATELGLRRTLTSWLEFALSVRHVFNRRAQDGRLTGPLFLNKDRNFDLVADAWAAGQYERLSYNDHVFSADVQLNFKLPYNALIAGVTASYSLVANLKYEANFENATSRSTSAGVAPTAADDPIDLTGKQFLLPNLQRRMLALFVQDTFSPWNWLDVIGGVRLDLISDVGIISEDQLRADKLCAASTFGDCTPRGFAALAEEGKNYFQVSPRAGIVAKAPVLGIVGKVLFGQSFTPPPLGSLANQTAAETRGGSRYANPFLNSIIGRTLEVGAAIKPVPQMAIRASYFHIATQNEVIYATDLEGFFNNAERAVNGAGLEVLGDHQLGQHFKLSYRGSFTGQSTIAVGGRLTGFGADVYPAVIGSAWITGELFEHVALTLGTVASAASKREADDTRPMIPASAILSANLRLLNLPTKGFELGVLAKNLLDHRQQNALPRFVGLPNDFPSGGRSVLFYVSWTLNKEPE